MEDWIADQSHLLNTYYKRGEVDGSEGERLITEIQVTIDITEAHVFVNTVLKVRSSETNILYIVSYSHICPNLITFCL